MALLLTAAGAGDPWKRVSTPPPDASAGWRSLGAPAPQATPAHQAYALQLPAGPPWVPPPCLGGRPPTACMLPPCPHSGLCVPGRPACTCSAPTPGTQALPISPPQLHGFISASAHHPPPTLPTPCRRARAVHPPRSGLHRGAGGCAGGLAPRAGQRPAAHQAAGRAGVRRREVGVFSAVGDVSPALSALVMESGVSCMPPGSACPA